MRMFLFSFLSNESNSKENELAVRLRFFLTYNPNSADLILKCFQYKKGSFTLRVVYIYQEWITSIFKQIEETTDIFQAEENHFG